MTCSSVFERIQTILYTIIVPILIVEIIPFNYCWILAAWINKTTSLSKIAYLSILLVYKVYFSISILSILNVLSTLLSVAFTIFVPFYALYKLSNEVKLFMDLK